MNARVIPVLFLLVVVGGVVGVGGYRVKAAMERKKAAEVQAPARVASVAVAVVEKRDVPQVVSINGVVRAVSDAQVFPKIGGRVTKIAVEVGQSVKAGDTLAVLDSVDLSWRVKQAEAQLKAAQAGLENAKLQRQTATRGWERAKGLFQKAALSQADYEQAEAGFGLAGVGVQAAEAQVALAEAALGLTNQAFADSRITAPFAGVVAKKMIELGSQASPMQPAFVVQDQTSLKMQGTVPAADVALLKKGMPVKVTADELPGRALEGQVASIAPSLEADTRRAAIELTLKPAEGLMPNMFGRAEIGFGEQAGALVIPSTAVISTADGAVVYAVHNDKAELVKPKLGARVGSLVVVVDGLEAGEKVIISGDTGLQDGARVAVAGES